MKFISIQSLPLHTDFLGYWAKGWCPKFATGLDIIIDCSSKIKWVIKLSLYQNDPLINKSFWQNLYTFWTTAYHNIYPSRKFWASPSVIILGGILIAWFHQFPMPKFRNFTHLFTNNYRGSLSKQSDDDWLKIL